MDQIIFRIYYSNPTIQQIFTKYSTLINESYARRNIGAMFEVIDGGALYIIKNLAELNAMVAGSKGSIMQFGQSTPQERMNFKTEFFGSYTPAVDEQFELFFESFQFPMPQMLEFFRRGFQGFESKLIITPYNETQIRFRFPNFDAMLDYLIMITKIPTNKF
jgi:hypothetical protein